jgi:hypothetical protein
MANQYRMVIDQKGNIKMVIQSNSKIREELESAIQDGLPSLGHSHKKTKPVPVKLRRVSCLSGRLDNINDYRFSLLIFY